MKIKRIHRNLAVCLDKSIRYKFKGLDFANTVTDQLRTQIHNDCEANLIEELDIELEREINRKIHG
jgi:hypothetical protein